MRKKLCKKVSVLGSCLILALCVLGFGVCAAQAAGVTWEFKKVEEDNGKQSVRGILKNHGDKPVISLDSYSWNYEQNGKLVEKTNSKPMVLSKPLLPGTTRGFSFTVATPGEISNFTVMFFKVSHEGDPPAAPAKPAGSAKPAASAKPAPGSPPEKVELLRPQAISLAKEDGNYVLRYVIHNNSSDAVQEVISSVNVTYADGSSATLKRTLSYSDAIRPGGFGRGALRVGEGGREVKGARVTVTDAKFAPYRKPGREYGPKKGNIVWTCTGQEFKNGKWTFATTLMNNTSEDLVTINTYTLVFDHDYGTYSRDYPTWILQPPLKAYGHSTPPIPASVDVPFKNIRNVRITDVSYMTRPTSARPKQAAPAAKPAAKPAAQQPASVASASFNIKSAQWDENKKGYLLTCEVLNNSDSKPLVRLDNVVLNYASGGSYSIQGQHNAQTITVNIPPLGTRTVRLFVNGYSGGIRNIKIQCTPRFGQAQQQSGGQTVIIRQ